MDFLANIDNSIILGIKICLIAILGDAMIGWLIAYLKGEFDIRKVPQFLKTNILPYIGSLFILGLLATLDSIYLPVFAGVVIFITGKFSIEALKDKVYDYFKSLTTPHS